MLYVLMSAYVIKAAIDLQARGNMPTGFVYSATDESAGPKRPKLVTAPATSDTSFRCLSNLVMILTHIQAQ